MGQYYKFMNVDKKQICEKNRHGWKLMEHSYLGNDYCDDILRLLSNEWKGDRVIQVGDYAEPNDETTTQNTIEKILKELEVPEGVSLYDYGDSFENINSKARKDIRYVYNLDKKEYVDLFKQPIQWCYHDDKSLGAVKINSFALLIGCGNGLGGGDYHGVNEELVGYWAGDKFVSSSEPIKEYDNFTLRDDIYTEMDYGDLESYYEEEILETEKDIFKSELEKYKKYDHDISKLSFDSYGLLEEEQKVLESIFTNNKDKKKEKEEDVCI